MLLHCIVDSVLIVQRFGSPIVKVWDPHSNQQFVKLTLTLTLSANPIWMDP